MFRLGNKIYKPKPLLRTTAAMALIFVGGMIEAATRLDQFILPTVLIVVLGYITLSDTPDR